MLVKKRIILSTRSVVWGITLFNFGLVVLGFIGYVFYYETSSIYIIFMIPTFLIFSILMLCYIEQRCHKFFAIRIFRMNGKDTLNELLSKIFSLPSYFY
ncbi:hypothetical protein [Helicobacter mesocricetorum]|uniref:hypothetical protein n=1 Tax=Helicobacter mesocricetorum TaxID=87012 RepID=UPI0013150D22|nr:hypothetical protein [Helicobacter mesocricetorum]